MTVTAQEATTLPEGAMLTLAKCEQTRKNGGMLRYTSLTACRNGNVIEMKVDDVAPNNLPQYMGMIVREITRRRANIKEKPLLGCGYKPKTLPDFVTAMALNDMFCFEALTPRAAEEILKGDPKPKKSRRRKVKQDDPTKPF
jgi:hypothetical protein